MPSLHASRGAEAASNDPVSRDFAEDFVEESTLLDLNITTPKLTQTKSTMQLFDLRMRGAFSPRIS